MTSPGFPINLRLPDLWQQEAVRYLKAGRDVIVDAPTGAGKTRIFELLVESGLKGQAIYTVPTRALANDKRLEWLRKGWDTGIVTGDLSEKPDAPVVVATLETQRERILRGDGPALMVVDEYQMLGDPVRGLAYELALALLPHQTRLLLLSGSVGNARDVADWLRRLDRSVEVVSTATRPVPLEEMPVEQLPRRAPKSITGFWPRLAAEVLMSGMGPLLIFAPQRKEAEKIARQIASGVPTPDPLNLTREQEHILGGQYASLLQQRVAVHHSGMSYQQRAGVIEPLAKAGQLRVVVSTTGLAAGINFSMRSVTITDARIFDGRRERDLAPDELLQMFGRAGRRGLDDAGFALISERTPRLHDARARQLKRATQTDWPTSIAVMHAAVKRGAEPFSAALELNRRLFTPHEILLGVEHARATGPMPCGFEIDAERARFARRGMIEMTNSRGDWEPRPERAEDVRLGDALLLEHGRWRPALSLARTLEGIGIGGLCKLGSGAEKKYGREAPLGTRRSDGSLSLAPWLKRLLHLPRLDLAGLDREVFARFTELTGGVLDAMVPRGEQLVVRIRFDERRVTAWRDSLGRALLDPPTRRELPLPCRGCPEFSAYCEKVEIVPSPAHAWRQLGLIDRRGEPTRRGIIFSFFHQGEGLAVAAALEDESYAISDLVFDLANLRAGPRFAGDDPPLGGRLGALCQQIYERADLPGYLEMGVPLNYGAGASEAVREILEHGTPRQKLLTEFLRSGDLERGLIEWRSLLRHIVWAPDFAWPRWRELKTAAAKFIESTTSPTVFDLPPLTGAQMRRRG